MAKPMITKQQIDELLRFLPVLDNPGPETAAQWRAPALEPKPGVIYMRFPVYPPAVDEFFSLASQECWCGYHYDAGEAGAMVQDDRFIASASLDQIKTMLTFCTRGERFCDGHWDDMVSRGRIGAILRRLTVLRDEAPDAESCPDR